MTSAQDLLARDFATLSDLLHAHAAEQAEKVAIASETASITYAELDRVVDHVAAALQREGLTPQSAVGIIAASTIEYACAFLGALRAGCVVAPLAPSSSGEQLSAMLEDCDAQILFLDREAAETLGNLPAPTLRVALDDSDMGIPHERFIADGGTPEAVEIHPDDPFNIIYSSGTTGTPKGIVQSHAMRWSYAKRNAQNGFADAVTMIATPLYSNTTLVSFLPTLTYGGTVVLMKKFDARTYLELAERYRATHTMLVPVQYQRIMAQPEFDRFDLSSFRLKTCTSAPFSAALKADIVARWPGRLIEFYGMTEGGGGSTLDATAHPHKLHTVGQVSPGAEIRLIDDEGNEVTQGETGEVVGRSGTMMNGYHGRADATRDAEWHAPDGTRFIRHGDVGRFDEDGFLILMDRKKDLIISGGFNIYPSDLESVLAQHPAVADATVIGVPSEKWGESPVGVYVPQVGAAETAGDILAWTNQRLGKTQRLAALTAIDELPRSAIGKVLKRELRDRLGSKVTVA